VSIFNCYVLLLAVIVLKVDSRGKTLMFELPHDDLLKSMLSELRRTVQR